MWSPKLIETICDFFGEQVFVGTHGVGPASSRSRRSREACQSSAALRVGEETRGASTSPEVEAH